MKHFTSLFRRGAVITAVIAFCACKKDHPAQPVRTIQYQLYTDQDFSDDQHTITFRLLMRTAGNKVLFDSALAPMLVSAVPDKAHQLVFRKVVPPGYENAELAVGFPYAIKDIGESWYIDTCAPGQTLKIVDYNFK
jgi:hypothetical protein